MERQLEGELDGKGRWEGLLARKQCTGPTCLLGPSEVGKKAVLGAKMLAGG
jgi:hypothetical protein